MDLTKAFEKIEDKLGYNTSRIITIPYLLFFMLCSLHWLGWADTTKQWFLSLSNSSWLHILGFANTLITIISLWKKDSRSKFLYHLSQIFKKDYQENESQNLTQPNLAESDFVNSLMEWSKDAHEIYIFGGSANFLKDENPTNNLEFEELKKLGKKCKFLITENFSADIDKLWDLSKSGVEIRTYPYGDLHIRGRLKKNTFGTQSYLCSKKNGSYTTQSIPLLEVSKLLLENFNGLFNNGGNPFIKCIMFDKGGVWCDMCDTEWKLNNEISELANQLNSKGYSVVIHSNCNSEIGEKLKKEDFFKGFRMFFSYEMNVQKPKPAFYNAILTKLKFKPFQCVFIDDNDENIDSAKEFGMKTIKVSTYSESTLKLKTISIELEKLQVKN